MVARRVIGGTAVVLALILVWMPAAPQAQGQVQQGGLAALAPQVQALEAAVKQLQEDLAAEIAARMGADPRSRTTSMPKPPRARPGTRRCRPRSPR
jgi:hypothetical protein